MIIKTKKVYYCEFCKKHSLLPLVEHEKHCTGNINRTCRMCAEETGGINLPEMVEKWKKIAEVARKIPKPDPTYVSSCSISGEEQKEMEKLVNVKLVMDDANGCPACSLAIILLAKLAEYPIFIQFDFKKEKNDWWEQINADRNEGECYY